jgi:hypothetical protein
VRVNSVEKEKMIQDLFITIWDDIRANGVMAKPDESKLLAMTVIRLLARSDIRFSKPTQPADGQGETR